MQSSSASEVEALEPAFAPVRRDSATTKVYAAIRGAILSGQVRTGQRLVEIPLAKQFAVSRAVVREALQRLAHEGLVQQSSYKGTRVVRLSPEEIDEIVHVRLLLECDAAARAATRLTPMGKSALRALAKKMGVERDITQFSQLDLQLHQQIWEIAENATAARLLEQVAAPLFAMSLLMRNSEKKRSATQQRRGDHTPLVEEICSGDEARASEAMRFHLTENWTALKKRLIEFLKEQE